MVDVRSPAEFSGEVLAPPHLPQERRSAGHIPGAANVPWAGRPRGRHLQERRGADRALRRAGVTPDTDVIAYCRIGERSSHTWFVLTDPRLANVRNYDGSWTEYGCLVGCPSSGGSVLRGVTSRSTPARPPARALGARTADG